MDFRADQENLQEELKRVADRINAIHKRALINSYIPITKFVGAEIYLTFHNGWDTIPILDLEWTIKPKGHDHAGMYFMLCIWQFQFELNICSQLHADDDPEED